MMNVILRAPLLYYSDIIRYVYPIIRQYGKQKRKFSLNVSLQKVYPHKSITHLIIVDLKFLLNVWVLPLSVIFLPQEWDNSKIFLQETIENETVSKLSVLKL